MKRLLAILLLGLVPTGCAALHRAPPDPAPVAAVPGPPVAVAERPEVARQQLAATTSPVSFFANPPARDQSKAQPIAQPAVGSSALAFAPTPTEVIPPASVSPASVTPASPAEFVAAMPTPAIEPEPGPGSMDIASVPAAFPAVTTPPQEIGPESAARETNPPESVASPAPALPVLSPQPPPPSPALEPKPAAIAPPALDPIPPQPKGRAVARVGDEVVTLPVFTDAVKRRLQLLPPGTPPTRKLIIRVARSTLESLIEQSLIKQEARRQFPDQTRFDAALAEADGRWFAEELPRLLSREGVASEAELRTKLARQARSLDDLREMSRLRTLAMTMMTNAGGNGNLEGYLSQLRRQTPITSIMTPAQVAASQGDPAAKAGGPGA